MRAITPPYSAQGKRCRKPLARVAVIHAEHLTLVLTQVLLSRTLGTFSVVRVDGGPIDVGALRRQSAVLKYLLIQPGHAASSAIIAGVLWPESDPTAARTNLRSAVYALRRMLASHGLEHAIVTERGRLSLPRDVWRIDLDDFERAAVTTLEAPAPDLVALRAAIDAYGGPLLPDDLYVPWAEARREQLATAYRALLLRFAASAANAGGDERALLHAERAARQAFEQDPADEPAAATLMRLQLHLSRRDDALQTYRRHVDAVGGEGHVGAELRELAAQAHRDPAPALERNTQPPTLWVPPAGPRFVGRELEVARLGDLLDRAFDGNGSTALLIGDAGIGKTRTAAETITEAQDRGALVLAISCWHASETSTFSMLTQALDRAVEALAYDDLIAIFAGLAPRLLRLMPALRRRFPRAVPLPQLPGYLEIQRYRAALLAAIDGLARRWPVVVSIDDIHAANDQTVALFSALVKLAPATKLLVLATARTPEFEDSAAAEVIELSCGAIEILRLGPLDQRDAVTLAAIAAQGVEIEPTEVALKSGGNPLFILELARGGGRITSEVRAAAAARIAHLAANDRKVVELAALARTMPLSETTIAAILSLEEFQAISTCERLMAAGMLQRDRRGYALAHQILGEVVQETIAPERAAELHGRLGELPELVRRPAIAAYHFARAGKAYADEALDATLATIRLLQPVEELARHGSTLRLAYARCAPDDARRYTLALALGQVEIEVGSSNSAEAVLVDALTLARTPGERAAVSVALAHLRALQLRVHEGLRLCAEAERLASDAEMNVLQNAWLVRAMLCGRIGDTAGAKRAGQRLIESDCDVLMHIRASNAVGTAHLNSGELEEAQGWFEKARDLAREHHAERDLRAVLNNLAILDIRRGRIRRARDDFAAAGEAAVLSGRPWEAAVRARNAAEAELYLGDLDAAEDFLRSAEQRARRHFNPGLIAEVAMVRGLVAGDRGDYRSAIHFLDDAARAFRESGFDGREAECCAHALVTRAHAGIVAPKRLRARTERLATNQRDVNTRAYSYAALSLAYGIGDDGEESARCERLALSAARVLAEEVRYVEILLVLAESRLALGDDGGAHRHCERARVLQSGFDGLRLQRWLDDLSRRLSLQPRPA